MRALACPASLKGVLAAADAAAALAEGLRRGGAETVELPVADGGEGTVDALFRARGGVWHRAVVADAFGRAHEARWLELPDGTAVVEAAEAIPLDPARLDPMRASSRGLGELIAATGSPAALLVGLGGTATVDGGAGLREVLDALPAPTRVACDSLVPLLDAARLYAPQKGATPAQVEELAARLAAMEELAPFAGLPGAGAAGGLGAALAALGAELVPGAALVLDTAGFDPARLRPRRHRRGPSRPHDGHRQGSRRGRATLPRRGRPLRRLRRARRRAARGRRDGRALGRSAPGTRRSRRARATARAS